MEWKTYYRDEFSLPKAGPFLDRLFESHTADPALDARVKRGSILSFPHTSLFYGGDAQARVVCALYRLKVQRIIALGVFHVWGLPATRDLYRQAMDPRTDSSCRSEAFRALRGGFLPRDNRCETPFGPFALGSPGLTVPDLLRREDAGLLDQEYSLDTFLALLALYDIKHDVPAPEVVLVYIGMTRDPLDGSFDTARDLAALLDNLRDTGTAFVATGDVTHYGTGYTPDDLLRGRPSDPQQLRDLLEAEVREALGLVIHDRDHARAFPILDRQLNNDQRYLLPVISELLGPESHAQILDFQLSDYTAINHVPPPCFVTSSLVAHSSGP